MQYVRVYARICYVVWQKDCFQQKEKRGGKKGVGLGWVGYVNQE